MNYNTSYLNGNVSSLCWSIPDPKSFDGFDRIFVYATSDASMPTIHFRVMNTDTNTQENPVGDIIGSLPLTTIIKAAQPPKPLTDAPTVIYLAPSSPTTFIAVLSCGIVAVIETLVQRFSPAAASPTDPLSAKSLIAAAIQQTQSLVHLTPRVVKTILVPTGALSSLTAASSVVIPSSSSASFSSASSSSAAPIPTSLVATGSSAGILTLVNTATAATYSWIAGFPVQQLKKPRNSSTMNDSSDDSSRDETVDANLASASLSGLPIASLYLSDATLLVGTKTGTLLHHTISSSTSASSASSSSSSSSSSSGSTSQGSTSAAVTSSIFSHIPDLLASHPIAPSSLTYILPHPRTTLASHSFLLSAANGVVYFYRTRAQTRTGVSAAGNSGTGMGTGTVAVPIYASDVSITRMATVAWANIVAITDNAGRIAYIRSTPTSTSTSTSTGTSIGSSAFASSAGVAPEEQWSVLGLEDVHCGSVATVAVDAASKVLVSTCGACVQYAHLPFKADM